VWHHPREQNTSYPNFHQWPEEDRHDRASDPIIPSITSHPPYINADIPTHPCYPVLQHTSANVHPAATPFPCIIPYYTPPLSNNNTAQASATRSAHIRAVRLLSEDPIVRAAHPSCTTSGDIDVLSPPYPDSGAGTAACVAARDEKSTRDAGLGRLRIGGSVCERLAPWICISHSARRVKVDNIRALAKRFMSALLMR
jgi:hypothetical protein